MYLFIYKKYISSTTLNRNFNYHIELSSPKKIVHPKTEKENRERIII